MVSYRKISWAVLLLTLLLFSYQITFAGKDFPPEANPPMAERSEIYSKLKCCPCKVSFDKCICKEAKEMKAYIDALLEMGAPKDEILYKVAKKFSLNTILDEPLKLEIQKRLIKEAGENRPVIILEPNSFDFGQVSLTQEKVTKVFKIHNKGITDLIITNIKAHCGCTTVSLKVDKEKSPYFGTEGVPEGWQAMITSGKSADLEVALDLKHRSITKGKLFREISIFSNDPLYPEVKISVEAEVID